MADSKKSAVPSELWTYDKVIKLIGLFKDNPVMWDPKHPSYRSRSRRKEVVLVVSAELDIDAAEVERKIVVLMAQYRKIKTRLNKMKRFNVYTEDTENDLWFGYKHMKFLDTRYPVLDPSLQQDTYPEEREPAESVKVAKFRRKKIVMARKRIATARQKSPNKAGASVNASNAAQCSDDSPVIVEATNQAELSASLLNNEIAAFGERVATKLSKFDKLLRLEVEHSINCLLYETEMNMLRARQVEFVDTTPIQMNDVEYPNTYFETDDLGFTKSEMTNS